MLRTQNPLLAALGLVAFAGVVHAQSFQINTTQVPPSSGFTENVDFGDVDLDGDWDAVFAQGGDCCNQQNTIWINQGGAQGGTVGFFQDKTSTQFPNILDDGRDIEFADIDADGDLDIYLSATSDKSNQSNLWWINMGGIQGGTLGFYQDQTATRWVGLGGPGSSIAPGQLLGSGGFIDFSCDCDFGDLDNDGDLDLVHSSYGGTFGGKVPTRIFENDGNGFFSEFNPSGFQLPGQEINNGNPGIWCEGTQSANTTNSSGAFCDVAATALDIDLGDIDGDLDLDILHGARVELPRMFANRLEENGGVLGFRDITGAVFPSGYSFGNGHYEQEIGDLDNDDDLDIYGLNWQVGGFSFNDITLTNNGSGVYSSATVMSGSGADDNEADFLDYDQDGDLDVFIANFAGQDRLYRNNYTGAGFSYTNVTSSQLPSYNRTGLDADACDVDDDGDTDVIVANDSNQSETFLKNITQVADTHAPRIVKLEQAPDRPASPIPTVVRVQVYDNAPYYITWYNPTSLEYSVNGGAFSSVAMMSSQGQIFRGEIPGQLVGSIAYRVRSADKYGNQGLSATKIYNASSGCSGSVSIYCTAKVNSLGCTPAIGFSGVPSASAGSGFTIGATNILAAKFGLLFYSKTGANASPFQGGFLCALSPLVRTPVTNSGGGAGCTGSFQIDFNAYIASGKDPALVSGQQFWSQWWYRDPASPSTTGLTDALTATVCP